MRKSSYPHWIKHSHFFDPDEYECSECGRSFQKRTKACPYCGAKLKEVNDDQGWIDDLEMLDMILDDN